MDPRCKRIVMQEDKCLVQIVECNGKRNWLQNSAELKFICGSDRSGKQCRERWHNYLNPQIEKVEWSREDDERLFYLQSVFGNKWKKIMEHFPGRSESCVKNRFYSSIRKALRRFNKSLGFRNSTMSVKNLKSTDLTKMLHFAQLESQKYPEIAAMLSS